MTICLDVWQSAQKQRTELCAESLGTVAGARGIGHFVPAGVRRQIGAVLVALLVWAPLSRASERLIDVLVVSRTGIAVPVPEISPAQVRATFGGHKLSVVAVQRAEPILRRHTVVLLDFQHASATVHSSMIMETLQAMAAVRDSEITVIAVGNSENNLELFDLADNRKVGLLLPQKLAGEHVPQGATNFPGMYWQTWAGLDLISTVANGFDAVDAPVRVIWISDDFTWVLPLLRVGWIPDDLFNSGPCYLDDVACQAMRCLAGRPLNSWDHPYVARLSETGITFFPLSAGADGSRGASHKNHQGAEYLANAVGGFPIFTDTLGDGKALTRALQLTSAGYVVRLSGSVQRGEVICPDPLQISIDVPHIRFRRDFTIVAENQIMPQIRDHYYPVVPAFNELSTDFSCGDKASGEVGLKIAVPETIKSALPGKFYVHVLTAGGPLRQFVFNRHQLNTGEAAQCFCVPLSGRPETVRLVSAYDEATRWAAVKKLDASRRGD